MEIFLGSHHFLSIMKHTPPPLVLPASALLSLCKTEKLSDGENQRTKPNQSQLQLLDNEYFNIDIFQVIEVRNLCIMTTN